MRRPGLEDQIDRGHAARPSPFWNACATARQRRPPRVQRAQGGGDEAAWASPGGSNLGFVAVMRSGGVCRGVN
jgi:hypothetical protein